MLSFPLTDRLGLEVNLASGNLLVHATDLAIPGTGLPLVIDRWYNNLTGASHTKGSVGDGWTLSVGQDVHQTVAAYNGPSDYQISVSGDQVPGVDATLVYDPTAPSPYVLTFNHSGVREDFNQQGDESAIIDANGNTITLSPTPKLFYQPSGAFSSIIDTQGRTTSVTNYTVYGTITGFTDPSGRTVGYTVDSETNLTSFTDANGKQTTYGYDPLYNDLTQITDPNGEVTALEALGLDAAKHRDDRAPDALRRAYLAMQERIVLIDEASLGMGNTSADPARRAALQALA